MHVILDSNQFISDLQIRSQRFRVLANYLERTTSQLWLLDAVLLEVTAHYAREVKGRLAEITTAVRDLHRLGVELDCPNSVGAEEAVATWRAKFLEALEPAVESLPFDASVVEEAFFRAVHRLPPCKPNGEGMRDAIIWLAAIKACKDKRGGEVAFISSNTKDFASADRNAFRSELQEDLARSETKLTYFPSLEDFNRAHADRIAHITVDWILERVSFEELASVIKQYVSHHADMLHPSSKEHEELYEPWAGQPYFHTVEVTVSHFYVWQLEPDRIVLSLATGAFIEADLECRRVRGRDYSASAWDIDDEIPLYQVLTCHGDIGFDIEATVEGDRITVGRVEEAYKL